jgi:hypothetical protein
MKPKRRRAISKLQDRKVMGALGGRVQPASGSMGGYKGDGRVFGRFRVETKYTVKDTYRLDVRELFKIAGEASDGEVPVMVIDFKEPSSARVRGQFAIVPFHYFEKVSRAETDDDS